MSDLIQELEQAFQMLSTIPVCGDAVDRMALARAHLVNAYRIERANEEALNAREQGTKAGAAGKAQGGATGPGWVSPKSEDLGPVAEGMKRDNEEARSHREQAEAAP